MSSTLVGPGNNDAKEVQYLGRLLRWREDGITIEGDPKHLKTLKTLTSMGNCSTVSTPVNTVDCEAIGPGEPLISYEVRRYRGAAALISYMSQDRADLSVAATYLAKAMAHPTQQAWMAAKRVVRYLTGVPRIEQLYPWGEPVDSFKLETDSDWARCGQTRKSHSGGVLSLGPYVLSHWCRIQPSIALSSGEAELHSSTRGLINLLGLWNLARELRGDSWGTASLRVDASACKSILLRKGTGSLKHLEVKDLWGQDVIRQRQIRVVKIPREANPADALASPCKPTDLWAHMENIRQRPCLE